jgi:hypothetical protein
MREPVARIVHASLALKHDKIINPKSIPLVILNEVKDLTAFRKAVGEPAARIVDASLALKHDKIINPKSKIRNPKSPYITTFTLICPLSRVRIISFSLVGYIACISRSLKVTSG